MLIGDKLKINNLTSKYDYKDKKRGINTRVDW